MIPRYTRPEMGRIWSDQNKFETWLKVEIAVCEAQSQLGRVPKKAVENIKAKTNFNVPRILEIEEEVKHDVIAFLTNVAEYVGEDARFIHLGMTSSDLLDTALALQMKEAGEIVRGDLQKLREVLKAQALKHKRTVCIGRSHGIHAEPTAFGLKFALWYDEMGRNDGRLNRAIEAISIGKVSGAVGNYAFIDPRTEIIACELLGLKPAPISTQVIQRDVHAEFMLALALIGCTVEKIAVEIRHLQRTEVMEAEEPFSKGQKGSSSMPHKRNPIGSENVTGLARLLRSNALAAMEDIALWHERDISHSSVERIALPDSCIMADFILNRICGILKNLVVYPQHMLSNISATHGLIFSQPLLLALAEKGMSREDAYKIVQEIALSCWQNKIDFQKVVAADERVAEKLSQEEIRSCFDTTHGLKHVDHIYRQVGIE